MLGLSLALGASGGGGGFNPASLFGAGEQGFVLDAGNAATAFQETTGGSATTATPTGGRVGSLKDFSPNNNWLTATGDSARPLWLPGLLVSGGNAENEWMQSASITMNQPFTRIMSWRNKTEVGGGFGCIVSGRGGDAFMSRFGSITAWNANYGNTIGANQTINGDQDVVTVEQGNGASSRWSLNGGSSYISGNGGTVNPGGLTIFSRQGGSQFLSAHIYRLVHIDRLLTDPEIAQVVAWCDKAASGLGAVGWGDSLSSSEQGGTWYNGMASQSMLTGFTKFPRVGVVQGVSGQNASQIRTRMVADSTYTSLVQVIWAGRNNVDNGAQSFNSASVQADIALMVAAAQARSNKYIVVSVTNANLNAPGTLLANSEASGSTLHPLIVAHNAALASTYGANYLDIRSLLVARGLTGDVNDQADAAADVPPRSLMVDDIHFSSVGGAFIGQQIELKMQALGY